MLSFGNDGEFNDQRQEGGPMGVVDFKEIPSAKGGEVGQDSWQFFARDFFSALRLEVEECPGRGPDWGGDLVVVEKRTGVLAAGHHKWLVSCKHFAHSGKAVYDKDEVNIPGRVRRFGADGFIGFYSTLPSSTLARTLDSLKAEIKVLVYDSALIERTLTNNTGLNEVFRSYLPVSFKRWECEQKAPYEIADSYSPLRCNVCGKDLLTDHGGIVGFVEERTDEGVIRIVNIYWACYGKCDRILEVRAEKRGLITGWDDISDLAIPLVFMKWLMGHMNNLRAGAPEYTDEAFENLKQFTLGVAQIVVRATSEEQRRRIEDLRSIPSALGGLG